MEIGGTWLTAEVQRTPVNTEAKLLLLTHAFEVWRVRRVAMSTDERNERSRRAIERIGATFEGVLRHHRPSKSRQQGQLRNSAMFAIATTTGRRWHAARAARPPARVTRSRAMNMLMVTAHPDPGSFCHAVSAAAKAGLERAGHHVTQLDLYALGFEPAMSVDEHRAYMAGSLRPTVVPPARRAAAPATDLVFVYPTWWSACRRS